MCGGSTINAFAARRELESGRTGVLGRTSRPPVIDAEHTIVRVSVLPAFFIGSGSVR
jgi:hypothetical protein